MRTIDMTTWPRRDHFALFSEYRDPFFDLTARITAPGLNAAAKRRAHSRFGVVLHALAAAVNAVEPFRQRIRGAEVVVHEVVHPSWVVLAEDGSVRFTPGVWSEELSAFLAHVAAASSQARQAPRLVGAWARDDAFYVSCMPWIDLIAVRGERSGRPEDSVPRFVWGRIGPDDAFGLTVTAHHGLVDGLHVGQLIQRVEGTLRAYASPPEEAAP